MQSKCINTHQNVKKNSNMSNDHKSSRVWLCSHGTGISLLFTEKSIGSQSGPRGAAGINRPDDHPPSIDVSTDTQNEWMMESTRRVAQWRPLFTEKRPNYLWAEHSSDSFLLFFAHFLQRCRHFSFDWGNIPRILLNIFIARFSFSWKMLKDLNSYSSIVNYGGGRNERINSCGP